MEYKIPLLTKNDVELRVATVTSNSYGDYVTLLAYKDARVDMRILDEVFGPPNWQRHHKLIGNNLYCVVSVYDPDKKEWIEKEDVGTESNTEKEKGQASDSFKRACFNWGIGRELYNAPFIRFKLGNNEVFERNNKKSTYAKFKVSKMKYDDEKGEFSEFEVVDKDGNIRYSIHGVRQPQYNTPKTMPTGNTQAHTAVQTNNATNPISDSTKDAQNENKPEVQYTGVYQNQKWVLLLGKKRFLEKLNIAELKVVLSDEKLKDVHYDAQQLVYMHESNAKGGPIK